MFKNKMYLCLFTFWNKFGQWFQKLYISATDVFVFILPFMLYHVVTCLCCALSVSRDTLFLSLNPHSHPRFTDRLSLKDMLTPIRLCKKCLCVTWYHFLFFCPLGFLL